jgi:hypothetical protein
MKMRTRRTIIWLCIALLGLPISIIVFGSISVLKDNAEDVAIVLLILSLTIAGWRLKRRLKERMERGLGREVDDVELTSITAWMRIPDQAARAGKEAEKYDFD